MAKTINAKDPGSLFVGNNPEGIVKGDLVQIGNESHPRRCSYVMGSVEKSNVHLCFKGSGGPIPTGKDEIEYKKVQAVTEAPAPEKKTA